MSRVRQWERKRVWADRLKRFACSGQTVKAFCAAEGCSLPSFYQWKRKLKDHPPSAFAELSVVASGPANPSSTHACVRLPNGVILAQVLKHSLTSAHNGASSC